MKVLSARDQTAKVDFPVYAFLHAFILSFIAAFILWGFQSWLDVDDMRKYVDAHEVMFNYIILIVAWLVTARPVYALDVRDRLVDRIHGILDDLSEWADEKASDDSDEIKSLFKFITANIAHEKINPENIGEPNPKTKKGKKIWKEFRTFTKDQMFSRPASLDGLCQVLIVIFHLFLMPILLLEKESSFWQSVISNFILAVYTTGCVGVARELENPYQNVTSQTLASQHFREYYYGLAASLKVEDFGEAFPTVVEKSAKGRMRGSQQPSTKAGSLFV
jgi:hypothetical protein